MTFHFIMDTHFWRVMFPAYHGRSLFYFVLLMPWIIGFYFLIKGFVSKKITIALSYLFGISIPYVTFVAFAFYIFVPDLLVPLHQTNFDSNLWKQAVSTSEPFRIRMVDDLLSKYQLVGKARSEIDALLGTPHRTDYFKGTDHYKYYDYVYWLGEPEGYTFIGSEWLVIKFKNNVVTEARVISEWDLLDPPP